MTDKKYSRLGSQIVLGTLNSGNNSDDEDIFVSDAIADRPELRVQLRYFTVELKPSRCSIRNNSRSNGSRNVRDTCRKGLSSVNGQKNVDSRENVSSTETTSCDSFHSCRSTTSVQEASCKGQSSDTSSKTEFGKLTSGTKRTVISDDDLLNHLTMVNAIFLSKSVSDSTHHESSCKTHQENVDSSCKTVSQRIPSSPNKVCSEAYTCQVNHNPRVKYISKIFGNNIKTKPFINSFDSLREKMGGDRLSYTKTFSESFEPVLNTKTIGLKIEENSNTYDGSDLRSGINVGSSSNLLFQNNICSDSPVSTYESSVIKVPEMKFAEIIPLCDTRSLQFVLNQNGSAKTSTTDHIRRETVPGCEESVEVGSSKKSSSLIISDQNEDIIFDPTECIVQGDGDLSGYAYTENSGRRLIFKNLDDTYLKMLISKSLKKIQNESEYTLKAPESDESDIFESEEEYDGFDDGGLKTNQKYLESKPTSLQLKKLKLNACFEESDHNQFITGGHIEHEDGNSLPMLDEYNSDDNFSEQFTELVAHDSSDLISKQLDSGFCKRGKNEKKRTLPVIEEEDSEESLVNSGDNLADDYCLIDSNGRPIHLFDSLGLPLTDNSGRPLRSAQGKLMMNCDQNGIPVVDHDCSIFDMFGRQPHEDRFDPSMAPKMAVCSKLSAGDGRPLLLFDAQGRPLTSVSGTMLVDSSGRGLVRLSTAPEHTSLRELDQ